MKKRKNNYAHADLTEKYKIEVGDRFYLNTNAVMKGLDIPDYNIITWIKGEFFGVKYENCGIGNIERTMGIAVLDDSNLNPVRTKPSWIFVNKDWRSQNKQVS